MTGARQGGLRTLLLGGGVLFVVRMLVKAYGPLTCGAPLSVDSVKLAGWALLWGLATLTFVPGLLLAEEVSSRWGHRPQLYTATVVLGSAVVALITVSVCNVLGVDASFYVQPGSSVPRELPAFLDLVPRVGLAVFIYAGHRQRLAAAQALRDLEARQTEMMSRLAESRLRTARAQVRPEALVEELRALERTYATDPLSAESVLDEMITRLRAASRSLAA